MDKACQVKLLEYSASFLFLVAQIEICTFSSKIIDTVQNFKK